MRTVLSTDSGGRISHMEFDLEINSTIIYSDFTGLRMFMGAGEETVVGEPTEGGSGRRGYREGVGTEAWFNWITGFVQVNQTSIIVVDSDNHCLRLVDRKSRQTSTFAGTCETLGRNDGSNAKFDQPFCVIKDPNKPNKLLVTDKSNYAVRQVDAITGSTVTLFSEWSGLRVPTSISFDALTKSLIITNEHYIGDLRNGSSSVVIMTGSSSDGFKDGKLLQAQYSHPGDAVPLSAGIRLVADSWNNRLRVVNIEANSVSSICEEASRVRDGSALTCSQNYPIGLLVGNGIIYVGEIQAIRTISCKWL